MKRHLGLVKRQRDASDDVEPTTARRTQRTSSSSSTRTRRTSRAASSTGRATSDASTDVLGSATLTLAPVPSNSSLGSKSATAAASASAAPEIAGLKQPVFIAIVAACGAVALLLVGLGIFCCCKRRKGKLAKSTGWKPIDSPIRKMPEDEKLEFANGGFHHQLSYAPSGNQLLPVRPTSPFVADFDQPSPTTPHSAQPLLPSGGLKHSYSGFYHPPSATSLPVPVRKPTNGGSSPANLAPPSDADPTTHYGMAISTPTLESVDTLSPPSYGPPTLFSAPPYRPKQTTERMQRTSQVDDVLNSFSNQAPSNSQGPMKNIGHARQPLHGLVEHHRLSIRSEAAEMGGESPPNMSPAKPVGALQPSSQPLPSQRQSPAAPILVPNIIVRSNSRDEGERYIFGHQPIGSTSSVGTAQILRQTSVTRSQHPAKLVSRQESLKRAAQPQPKFSQAEAESVGAAVLMESPDSIYSEFPPSTRADTAKEGPGKGFLTLQQMAMKEQHADFEQYRSPTYSLYGAYAVSPLFGSVRDQRSSHAQLD